METKQARKVALIVPTLNAGKTWQKWLEAFSQQTLRPAHLLVIDSGSTDGTVQLARKYGFQAHSIAKEQFNHGATRQLGADLLPDAELLIYMTQDAVLAFPEALEHLLTAFADPEVGVAYGRQLPNKEASPVGAHARLFNYPERSEVRSQQDIASKGFKAAFNSNSFACYRRSALEQVGGFPRSIILGEDFYVAAKMLLSGWKVAYVAEAQVYHSHDYTLIQEFQRYFDIGVFHSREQLLLKAFGSVEGEGLRFLRSELTYLLQKAPQKLPSALLRAIFKYTAYRLGRLEAFLPNCLKQHLAMHKKYFQIE
ncbi:Glucosyl-3-phosphoglycerate synthase [Meiothermus luteus]|uniref:Glucosyl-3-phosphoglycerate synthase n=1 Tax=Meiothermus luteus TaxID=2026184 RepID=A0A399EDB4_9DEIN|nr:glycosyltransferase family A protein [Meiothermus luteus]RIH81533.1 Glucosyl-3-phosphoglycerate synthase [Meiothermus luteus]